MSGNTKREPSAAAPQDAPIDYEAPLPQGEKFLFWIDEEGDYIVQAQREERGEFLTADGRTLEEAVRNMRETLDMAAAARARFPHPSVALASASSGEDAPTVCDYCGEGSVACQTAGCWKDGLTNAQRNRKRAPNHAAGR